ncbi:hypothetical protein EV195_11255 [Tenacibaculum skagerrakense]|uniref:Uncharacterized protein n=1 Tax=Tenacibaculum skagerrakense TaxID=186571 RepID=A0A4V2SL88_9FLAO|nr:hypothetical protein EV195_11255 [Tenacibaculum skagerrakense]
MEKKQENIGKKTVLTVIGQYNTKVRAYLAQNKLDAITQYTIKIFKDTAQRKKYSDAQYNKAVEEFNSTHGLLLLKRGAEQTQANATSYNYINFPYLNREGMKSAMDKYRRYVYEYNTEVQKENKEITRYNKAVELPKCIELRDLKKITQVYENKQGLFAREYNKAVEALSKELQVSYLPKKRIQKVKYTSELVFNVLVGFYISQLKSRNTYLQAVGRPTRVLKNDLPKLKIDNRKLATHTILGIPRLDFCKKTAQNHIKRLREAGVLINYHYTNQYKPISVHFNTTIVQVLEGKSPKKQNSQNQLVTRECEKKLPYNSDSSIYIKRKEIKDYENFIAREKCGLESKGSVCPADGYKNTTEISTAKRQTRAREHRSMMRKLLPDFLQTTPENSGTSSVLTRNFLSKLMDDRELAQELTTGKYNSYTGLSYHYLRKIEQYGNVSTDEFRAVLIQDVIKSSAKIWKHHSSVHVGSWKNAINELNEVLFSGITQKETLIEKLKEYRFKLEFARKWFLKHNHNALYPSLYFDVNRKSSSGVGFFGLHSVWVSHQKYKSKKSQEQNASRRNESARVRKASAKRRLDNAIRAYRKGKYTAKQLYDYVQDNLPYEYVTELTNTLGNTMTA